MAAPQAAQAAEQVQAIASLSPAQDAQAQESGSAAVGAIFDGNSFNTEGIRRHGSRLTLDGRELQFLGRGDFGAVYVHPRNADAVIKLVAPSVTARISVPTFQRELVREDGDVGRLLAQAGAGPRVHGAVSIPGNPGRLRAWFWGLLNKTAQDTQRPALVKERVHGESVLDLIRGQRFARSDYDLIQEMFQRMAQARVQVSDLRTANIMIGRTASQPQRRAYIVDGGELLPLAEQASAAQIYESIKHQRTMPPGQTPRLGDAPISLPPFDDILRAGLPITER
jgi:hypothetical protein